MLKPMVEPLMREENLPYPVWRGEIQPSDSWFDSYRIFINYFAEFAQQNSVEMFCVGCEYKATTDESEQWQRVIQGVRDRYSGPITYAADWTNYYNIDWWNSVDYVGIDAYFPLSIFDSDPTATQLQKVWTNYADEIEEWLEPINKPVIFTEIGYRSGDGTNMAPSNYWSDMSLDLQEQQDCYQAAFQTLWDKDWFYGFYWWTWIHDPTKGGLTDTSHTPQNKPTQDLITEWYAKDVQIAVIDQTVVSATVSSVNQHQSVMFHAKWQQNNADVADAKVYVNRTELTTNSTGWAKLDVTYSTVGKRSWVVTDIDHPQATRYTNAAPVPSIVWDELTVTVEAESSEFFSSNIKVTLLQEYTQTPVTGATVTVNGKLCEELAGGVYSLSINSWSPIEQLAVVVETDSMPARTVSSTVFLVMNTVFYGVIFGLALMVLFVFLKRRHVSPSSG
jgi:hypothetical protein